jgi:DNA repair exonuclease SbcCD ATPase subunit
MYYNEKEYYYSDIKYIEKYKNKIEYSNKDNLDHLIKKCYSFEKEGLDYLCTCSAKYLLTKGCQCGALLDSEYDYKGLRPAKQQPKAKQPPAAKKEKPKTPAEQVQDEKEAELASKAFRLVKKEARLERSLRELRRKETLIAEKEAQAHRSEQELDTKIREAQRLMRRTHQTLQDEQARLQQTRLALEDEQEEHAKMQEARIDWLEEQKERLQHMQQEEARLARKEARLTQKEIRLAKSNPEHPDADSPPISNTPAPRILDLD